MLVEGHCVRDLYCESCETSYQFTNSEFLYTDLGTVEQAAAQADEEVNRSDESTRRWHMFCDPIWCHACNAPSYCERIPELAEFEAAARLLRSTVRGIRSGAHRREFSDVETAIRERSRDDVHELARRLAHRRGSTRCLDCGSSSTTAIDLLDNLVSPLRHEHCGGPLVLRERVFFGSIRYAGWTAHYFDWNGNFRWSIRFSWHEHKLAWQPLEVARLP